MKEELHGTRSRKLLIAAALFVTTVSFIVFLTSKYQDKSETAELALQIPQVSRMGKQPKDKAPDPGPPSTGPEPLHKALAGLDAATASEMVLMGAFQVSGDLALLRAALERFPDSPDVLTAAAFLLEDPAEREAAAKRLAEVDPGNGAGPMILGLTALDAGDRQRAWQMMEEVAKRGKSDFRVGQAVVAARSFLRDAGWSPVEIARQRLATGLQTDTHSRNLIGQLANRMSKPGITLSDDPEESITRKLTVVENMKAAARPGSPDLGAVLGERNILASMPPDFEYGETGLTLRDRIAQLEKIQSDNDHFIDQEERVTQAVENLTDEEAVEFLDRVDTVSPQDAILWLMSRRNSKAR